MNFRLMYIVDSKWWRLDLWTLHDYADFMHNSHEFELWLEHSFRSVVCSEWAAALKLRSLNEIKIVIYNVDA